MFSFASFIKRRRILSILVLGMAWLISSCATPSKVLRAQQAGSLSQKSSTAISVDLSENGQALLPIVVSADATEREKAVAQTLADYLKKITGGEFRIENKATPLAESTPGLTLGVAARFNDAPAQLKSGDATRQEDYLLRSHSAGVVLVGSSELALEHAVWDFLYRLGHRQFFPGEKWEVIPEEKNLSIAVNALEHPDYYSRLIWAGFGYLAENRPNVQIWNARNRATAGIQLRTGHAYDGILLRNKSEFEKHPEYLTKPGSKKFCVSEPGLQQLVIKDALAQLEKNPELQSISMDPSDGGGWESDSCKDGEIYENITDRAITLANVVAEAITEKYPDKYVGLYAYNEHSPPPTIDVHPRVVVSIATGFIRGGYTINELFEGWSKKAQLLGVREYYSVNTWDRDLPGRAKGGNLEYLQRTIPDFHAKNARFLTAESSDNWAPNGLGYYIASRIMWDIREAENVQELQSDFFQKAFGAASRPMAEFYELIDTSNKPLLSDDLMGRLYRLLDQAYQSTSDIRVQQRLDDLVLYARYVELYSAYSQATGTERQSAFEELMRFTWRIRSTHMVHTLALWRDLASRDKQVAFSEGTEWRVPEDKNPWKSSEPFSNADVRRFVSEGIANNKLLDFTPVQFSDDLVPAAPLKLSSGKPGNFNMLRGNQDFYTWVEKTPATIELESTAGLIYQDRGPAKFELFPLAEAEMKSVADGEVAPDKTARTIQLQTMIPGLQRINVTDGSAGTSLSWSAGTPMTVESSLTNPPRFAGGRWTMYFYVPEGTKTIGGYRTAGAGQLLDPAGKSALKFTRENNPGYWSVPVASGQDGKLWQLSSMSGQVMLMTVPPYLARTGEELLLPGEVVQKDAGK